MTKKETLSLVKSRVEYILDKLEYIEFMGTKVYCIDNDIYNQIIGLDEVYLRPIRDSGSRSRNYSIKRFLQILNDEETIAYDYSFTVARKKASQIKNRDKCIDKIDQQFAISKKYHIKQAREQLDEEKNELIRTKIEEQLSNILKKEEDEYKYINNNLDELDFMITNYETASDHAQINFKYFNKRNDRGAQNSHVSKLKPNILLFESRDFSRKRSDMQIEDILKISKRAFGLLYYRKKINKKR